MRIIAKKTLREFWEKHPSSKEQPLCWYKDFSKANYGNVHEIKQVYGSADNVGNGRVVFNICGNNFRLVVRFNYVFQFAYIRFVGTHGEYDMIKDIKNM